MQTRLLDAEWGHGLDVLASISLVCSYIDQSLCGASIFIHVYIWRYAHVWYVYAHMQLSVHTCLSSTPQRVFVVDH